MIKDELHVNEITCHNNLSSGVPFSSIVRTLRCILFVWKSLVLLYGTTNEPELLYSTTNEPELLYGTKNEPELQYGTTNEPELLYGTTN